MWRPQVRILPPRPVKLKPCSLQTNEAFLFRSDVSFTCKSRKIKKTNAQRRLWLYWSPHFKIAEGNPAPPTNRHIIENQNTVNYLIYSDLCFLSYPKIPINIKEDVSNCLSGFSYIVFCDIFWVYFNLCLCERNSSSASMINITFRIIKRVV